MAAPVPIPPKLVTMISTTPAAWAGVVAVMVVALTTTTAVAATPPKVTLLAPVKLVPLIVTDWPPMVGPMSGETLATVGGAT